jgi:hypothetical protein
MFESIFLRIVKPPTLGPCWGGYFHFIPNRNPKEYRVQLIGVLKYIVYLIYANWVSVIHY